MPRPDLVDRLAAIEARGACTDAERRACLLLRDELRARGMPLRVEPVWVRPQWPSAWALHATLGVIGTLLSVGVPVAGLALLAATLVSFVLDATGRAYVLRAIFPRRATQLVEGYGYERGADGAFRDSSGQRLTLEMRTRGGDDLQEKTLFGASGYFQQLGITIEPLVFSALRANDREFRSTHPGMEVVRQPSGGDALSRYDGRDVPTAENNYRGVNRTRYRNAELDALIDRFVTTLEEPERDRIEGQMLQIVTQDAVLAPLFVASRASAVRRGISGLKPTAGTPIVVANYYNSWNILEWDRS